jgi:hypothetical protein
VAEQAFLRLLRWHEEHGIAVSAKPSSAFAPKVFAAHSKSEGFSKHAFKGAMERLLTAGKIKIEEIGPSYRRTSRIISAVTDDSRPLADA